MSTYLDITCKLRIWKGNFAEMIYNIQIINRWFVNEEFADCQSVSMMSFPCNRNV